MKVSNLSPALADQLRLDPAAEGVVIVDVANGSLAQRLGFQPGDVVLVVNNQKVPAPRTWTSSPASKSAVADHHPARRPTMSVELRG